MRHSSPQLLPLHRYKALTETQSIRLLEVNLLPDTPEIVSCLLSEHNIGDLPPSYAALSYVWGQSNSLVPILLNHHHSEVTINLHNALLQIRDTFPGMLLWVDALCIDQGSPQERNQQVAMMRDIYSKASHTITWLQPQAEHVEHLFHFIKDHQAKCTQSQQFLSGRARSISPPRSINSHGSLRRLQSSRQLRSSNRLRSNGSLRPTHPPVAYRPSTASLRNEYERPSSSHESQHYPCALDSDLLETVQSIEYEPYWNRVWIIQEIVVARKVLLMCGSKTIDWHSFVDFLRLLSNEHFAVPHPGSQQGLHRAFACSHRSFILRLSRWPQTVDLAQALDWSSTSEATDVRDKVYALLGLVNTGEGTSLIADYGVSPCVVFCLALRAIIRDWHRLLSSYPEFEQDHIAFCRQRIDTEARHITKACSDIAFQYLEQARRGTAHDHSFSRFSHCDGQECGSSNAMQIAAHWNKPVFTDALGHNARLQNLRKLASDLPDHTLWDKTGPFYHSPSALQSSYPVSDDNNTIMSATSLKESQEGLEPPHDYAQRLQLRDGAPPARASHSTPESTNCSVCLQNSYMRARLLRKRPLDHAEATCGACGRSWLSDLAPNRLLDISEGGFHGPAISWDHVVPSLPTECPECRIYCPGSKIRFATFDEPTHLECGGCQQKWYCFEDVFDVVNFQARILPAEAH